jgi:protein-tyrosine phosphatase
MMKALFVCTGNICRSVMAEQLFKKLSEDRGLGWSARSCGVAADPGMAVPPGVLKALDAAGAARFEHRPEALTPALVDWADLILTMTRAQLKTVQRQFPEAAEKALTLRDHAGVPGSDVADPFGEPDEAYAACRDRILEALEAMVEKNERAQKPRP